MQRLYTVYTVYNIVYIIIISIFIHMKKYFILKEDLL